MMAPETVAREAYAAVMRGRPVVIHGRHHRAVALALRHAPPRIRHALSNAMSAATRPGAELAAVDGARGGL